MVRFERVCVMLLLAACGAVSPASGDGGADAAVRDGSVAPDGTPTPDAGATVPPSGSWTDAGLDPLAGAVDSAGCAAGSASDHRYLYVRADAAAGGDGSRGAPLASIGTAISNVGAGQRATICIAAGTYDGGVGDDVDHASDGREIALVGGYASDFQSRDAIGHRTHLRGIPTAAVITFGNLHAITLDGLELSGGARGVYIRGGYSAARILAIRNCHVHDNGIDGGAGHEGGGMYLTGSHILIEHAVIEDNHGGRLGGGIFVGSAASSEQNHVDAQGGLVVGDSLLQVQSSIIRRNTLRFDTPHGVGMAIGMNAEIVGNVFADNHGYGVAGGGDAVGGGLIVEEPLATALIVGNWFSGNIANKFAAGVFIDEASIATVVNDVFVANVGVGQIGVDGRAAGSTEADRAYLTVINTTLAGSDGPAIVAEDATLHVVNTLCATSGPAIASYQGGALSQQVRVTASRCAGAATGAPDITFEDPVTCDPDFANEGASDYRLGSHGTCAGRGVIGLEPARSYAGAWSSAPALDASGRTRSVPPAIGAFEPVP